MDSTSHQIVDLQYVSTESINNHSVARSTTDHHQQCEVANVPWPTSSKRPGRRGSFSQKAQLSSGIAGVANCWSAVTSNELPYGKLMWKSNKWLWFITNSFVALRATCPLVGKLDPSAEKRLITNHPKKGIGQHPDSPTTLVVEFAPPVQGTQSQTTYGKTSSISMPDISKQPFVSQILYSLSLEEA